MRKKLESGSKDSIFSGLRWQLLGYQLSVMATILALAGLGVYLFFWRSLYRQLDDKLLTLAQSATLAVGEVEAAGEVYLNQLDEVPWRDIFNRDRQSLEWFDAQGELLAKRGSISLSAPPQVGSATLQAAQPIRTLTIAVFEDDPDAPTKAFRGYVRASQSTQDLRETQEQLQQGLLLGGSLALGLTGLGGFWLAQRAIHPVERSYEQLKQFTADASHELRGPLTAITTSVEVMQKHPERVHDKDRKKLSAIASAATQLHTLAEDLLLLARMDAQAIAAPPQKVDLNALLHRTVEFHRPAAQAKAISLQFEEKAMLSVLGYPLPLSRLFANLIQNALHYTPQGQVIVTLSQSRRSAHVCVADTGIGIAEAEFPCLFDRFWRADKARSRRIGGSGLGLAIVKAITQQHRGKISVSSQVNVGSTFHVYLPLVSSDGSMSPG